MAKNGKKIGNGFENRVAKDIRAHLKASRRDVYRTPGSGSHPCIGRMDVVIDGSLREKFPWNVECKKDRTFLFCNLFCPTAKMRSWATQAVNQAAAEDAPPLLIFQGLRTPIFCAVLSDCKVTKAQRFATHAPAVLHVTIRKGERWLVFEWTEFLRLV